MSTPQVHRRGTALRGAFIYLSDAGTLVTGLTQADFTIRLSKDGTGNQSTTGITLSEISAANNPGEYGYVAASTAFVATNGVYTLTITRTSDVRFSWEQTWEVNETGTPVATPASFTATVGDGRITTGGVAMDDADIYITLGGTFITETQTDATGLWGPVYLSDGTYAIRAQKAGYAQGTGSIVVSGSTVTGPGADIALAVGSTTDPMTAAQLWAYGRRQAVDATGTKADTIIKSALNDALDMVASAKLWQHLLRRAYLTLRGSYSTGTVTVTKGDATVVLATGTWPTWAASGRLFFSGQSIDIATRTSNTDIELATTWDGDTAAGVSYIVFQNEYDLPDNFFTFHKILPGQRWGWGPSPVPPGVLFEQENFALTGQRFANVFTIHNGAIALAPYPTSDETVAYTYYIRPERLSVDTDVADIEPVHLELLKRAYDVQLALQLGRTVSGDYDANMKAYLEAMGRDGAANKQPEDIQGIGQSFPDRGHALDWMRRT